MNNFCSKEVPENVCLKVPQRNRCFRRKHKKQTETILNNIIRKASKMLKKQYSLPTPCLKGYYYYFIHNIFGFLILLVILFSTHIGQLATTLCVISMDALSVVVLQDCPLTILEEKYLNTSSYKEKDYWISSLGLGYNCDHQYEKVLELIINIWCVCAFKILIINVFHMFHIQVENTNSLYRSTINL